MSGRLQRHYCKCCNAWMDDNKSSRQIHEAGSKHKEKMKEMLAASKESKAGT